MELWEFKGGITSLERKKLFYGWKIVGAGAFVQGYASTVFWRGFTAFFDPIVESLGWSRALTAAGMSIQRSEGGMISPFVGIVLKKFGIKKVMTFGIFTTGLSFVLMGFIQEIWHFYLCISLLTIGMSFGTFIVLVATVGNWFIEKRKLALSLMMSASGIGGLLVPVLVELISNFGWRPIIIFAGVGFWVVGFPATLVMRSTPEDYGLNPDGKDNIDIENSNNQKVKLIKDKSVKEIFKSSTFWKFAIATSMCQGLFALNLLHIPALTSFDVSLTLAGFSIAIIAFADVGSRLLIGFSSNNLNPKILMSICFFILGIGSLSLSLVGQDVFGFKINNYVLITIFALSWGGGFGASIPLRLSMVADFFGRKNYGTAIGMMSTIGGIFSAIAPILGGLVYDLFETYRISFAVGSILVFLAIPLILSIKTEN